MSEQNFFDYSKSPAPPKKSSAPALDKAKFGFIRYDRSPRPGAAEESVTFGVRKANGVHTQGTEQIKIHTFGAHVAQEIRVALKVSDHEAREVFSWYVGSAKGAQLLDTQTADRMEKLSHRFATVANPADLFRDQVEPFLLGLQSTARDE